MGTNYMTTDIYVNDSDDFFCDTCFSYLSTKPHESDHYLTKGLKMLFHSYYTPDEVVDNLEHLQCTYCSDHFVKNS